MLLNRMKLWFLVCGLPLLLVGTVRADAPPFVRMTDDFQWFDQPDLSHYGDGPDYRHTGYFGSVEALVWYFSSPQQSTIGNAGTQNGTTETTLSSFTTGWIGESPQNGTRYELGYIGDDYGWFASAFNFPSQTQQFISGNGTIILQNAAGGTVLMTTADGQAIPWTFDQRFRTYGCEVNALKRCMPGRHGAEWELFGGARFFNFTDEFTANRTTANVDTQHNRYWENLVNNRLVGPQIGVRFSKSSDRLSLIGEARGMAAGNWQTARLYGQLGSLDPATNGPPNFNSRVSMVEFSPLAEFRAKFSYQLFRSVSLTAGWTGMWTQNVMRASNTIAYRYPAMQILAENNKQMLWANGADFGIVINR